MNYHGNDPGAVQFGNFINYYQFNSAEERLQLLPLEIQWTLEETNSHITQKSPYLVLDVGCNSGNFTQLLYTFLEQRVSRQQVIILGVDIDPMLIMHANTNNHNHNIKFERADVMTNDFHILDDFLKFNNKTKFDAVFCLSITMWIHLNHSDIGLQKFLQNCSQISELLIVEAQPWKCYYTAVKRMKKANQSFPLYKELKWRNNVELEIQKYLETDLNRTKIYETPPTKWKRKILFYK